MPPKGKQKRGLENAGDVSISRAPAPPKKQKPVEPEGLQPVERTVAKTRSAIKTSDTNTADNEGNTENPPAEPVKIKIVRPKLKQPAADPIPEPQDDSLATPPPTKRKSASKAKQLAAVTQDATEAENSPSPVPTPVPAPDPAAAQTSTKKKEKQPAPPKEPLTKGIACLFIGFGTAADVCTLPVSIPKPSQDDVAAPLSPPDSRKSGRAKKPSEIAEKVNVQAAKKQNIKDAQTVKKAKKAEAIVIEETPGETAAVLARLKGASQPAPASPVVASPPRKRKQVDRTKAMEQLVSHSIPSPDPSLVSGASASETGTHTRTSSIAPSDSISQTNSSKPKKSAAQSLQIPQSGPASRNVSPTAPPSLSMPSSITTSRAPTPSAESAFTVADDDYDDNGSRPDINKVLAGVPPPWNLGPILPPPELPAPYHIASLKPEVLQQLATGGKEKSKDKSKAARASIDNFRDEDKQHLKLSLEFMDTLVATFCAFPNKETLWTFACLANHWASTKLKRNYRLNRDSEHFRLLSSRVSQSRGKLVTSTMSEGIRDHYDLTWRPLDEEDEDEQARATEEIRLKVADMIESGSFLAPAKKPNAYFMNQWLAHILKNGFWKGSRARGFAPHHSTHFEAISYPLLALGATVAERMLNVVASGPKAVAANNRNPADMFSHKLYYSSFDSHLTTIVTLHNSPAGPTFRANLTAMYTRITGKKAPTIVPNPTIRLTIPQSAFDNYGQDVVAPPPATSRDPVPSSSKRSKPQNQLASLLEDPRLSGNEKLNLIRDAIFGATDETLLNPRHASSSGGSAQPYDTLLTGVNAQDDSEDSEVQARRAGVLPVAGNPGSTGQAWASESDSEMVEGGEKSEIEGAGAEKDEDEGEPGEGGDGDEDGDGVGDGADGESDDDPEHAKLDTTMLDVESSEEDDAEGGADDARKGVEDAAEDGDEGEEDDDGDEVDKARARRFFTVDGGLASSDNGESTDGEGASGVVLPQPDPDASMQSADGSGEE
ncbi:hypothetical protein FRC09_003217 [Ceratobasidium sp. 395]|nr:hypothetical protein FRC09_003217 [Ceratobasidium sp. 395]